MFMSDTEPGDCSPNKSSREKIGSMVIIIYIQGGTLSVHWTCNSFSAVWKQLVSLQTWALHAHPVSLWYLRASRQLTMLQHKHCQFQNSFNFIMFFFSHWESYMRWKSVKVTCKMHHACSVLALEVCAFQLAVIVERTALAWHHAGHWVCAASRLGCLADFTFVIFVATLYTFGYMWCWGWQKIPRPLVGAWLASFSWGLTWDSEPCFAQVQDISRLFKMLSPVAMCCKV